MFISTVIVIHPEEPFWEHFLTCLLFTLVFWNLAVVIIFFFRRKFPKVKQTPIRLAATIGLLMLAILSVQNVLKVVFNLCTVSEYMANPELLFSEILVTAVACFSIGTIYETVFFFDMWKQTFTQNETLKLRQERVQLEVLQNQMSPHFLFNSLNTLSVLINEDQHVASEFAEKLSDVYRYILQNKSNELVPLGVELSFVKDYVYLLKMRYPANLNVEVSVDEKFLNHSIAPLTLQILIENAVKHNVTSKAKPLNIDIYVENGKSILVRNNLQLKSHIEKSTQTGLANIKKRYRYLGTDEVDVIVTQENFLVAIPLIMVAQESLNLTSVEE